MREIFYRPIKAICEFDGRVRTVRARSYYDGQRWCLHADTFFSVPAHCKIKGKHIAGYITGDENETGYQFRHMNRHAARLA